MKRFLPFAVFFLLSLPAFAQGACSNFTSGICPASVPSSVTKFYFFDYASGSDSNTGISESSPWQHMPTCANATSNSAAHTPVAGEGWIFKGGVTVDYHCWPANLPWGGSSSAADYIGPDPGWFTGAAWARPIFSGGGASLNADSIGGSLMHDRTHHASYLVVDNIEFTGFYWSSSTNCYVQSGTCGYISSSMSLTQSYDVAWEFKNLYAHNITHAAAGGSLQDQAPYGLFWMPRDAASSWHDGAIDNTDGSDDCCGAVFTANIYNAYFSGLDNVIYDPSAPSQQPTVFIVHDFNIANMTNTFQTTGSPPHGNCIHLFGNNPSSYYEFIYNGRIDCDSVNAETLELEEDYATVFAFNLVVTNEGQPNGFDTSSFTGAGHGGTYYYFDITEECGLDPSPEGPCSHLRNQPNVFHYNNFGIDNNNSGGPAIYAPSGWTGTFTSSPNTPLTCNGITTANFGGTLICNPVGSGNGVGNLNLTQTYPFAPLDSNAAAKVGTASALNSLCSTISGINAAAGTACLSDTTLGVNYFTSNHTVSYPARAPLFRPNSSTPWRNGAYEFSAVPRLPEVWVDNNACLDGTLALPTYELNLATQAWVGTAPGSGFHLPYWTVGSPTQAGFQSALNDVEAYRTAHGAGFYVDMPDAGSVISGAGGVYIPQSSSTLATNCIIVRSVGDANLPAGRIVGSHGMQDNLATSTDIGIRNPDLTGNNLSFQLGTAVTQLTLGGSEEVPFPYTLANGTVIASPSQFDDLLSMWTLEGSGSTPTAMRFCSPVGGGSSTSLVPACTSTTLAPDHWMFEDMEARPQAGDINDADIISMPGSGSETSKTQYPSYIFFEKDWVHGDWTSLSAGLNSVSNAFDLICQYCSIMDSQTSQNLRPGEEGHSVLFQGAELKLTHNWFEGQSIGFLSGGNCTAFPVANYVANQNLQEGRNRFTFPWSWLGVGTISGNAHWNGSSLVRKNANEMKAGQWIVRYGNINENVDTSGGQGGVAGDIKTTNDSCALGANYQNITSDVTDDSNIYRNALETYELVRNPGGAIGGVDFGIRRVSITNSLFYNISETNFGGSETQGFQINQQAWAWQGTATENANGTVTFVANCSVNQGGCIGQVASVSISGCGGAGTWTASAPNLPGGTVASGSFDPLCVATVSNPGSGYTSAPTITPSTGSGTATLTTSSSAPGTGYAVLDMLPGDPATLYQCSSVISFNQPTPTSYSSGFLPNASSASQGALVVAGVNPASLTTTFSWPTSTTPSGSSDTAGYCKLTNMQSFPQNFNFVHNDLIQNSSFGFVYSNGFGNFLTNGPNFQSYANIQDSIISNGGIANSSGIGAGSATVKFNVDTSNSTVDHLLIVGANSSSYTTAFYGNNPNNPVATPGLYFPATAYCTGVTATSACAGFVGAEYYNASSMVLAPSDYHHLKITTGTYYAAGGTGQASDGTDQGPNISAVDAAETANLYVCGSPCGSGPYPDVMITNFTVNVAVYGGGTVTDNDSQISCPIACSGIYSMGFTAILTATPAAGYAFAGWSGTGGCSGTGTCSLTASANPTATFSPIATGNNVNLSSGTAMSGGTAVTQ
jgi:hypothetical protein